VVNGVFKTSPPNSRSVIAPGQELLQSSSSSSLWLVICHRYSPYLHIVPCIFPYITTTYFKYFSCSIPSWDDYPGWHMYNGPIVGKLPRYWEMVINPLHFKFKDSHCMGWQCLGTYSMTSSWLLVLSALSAYSHEFPCVLTCFDQLPKSKKKKKLAPLKPDLDPLRILPVFEGGVMWYPKSYWESRYDPDTKYCCLHPGFLFVYMALDVYCFTMVTGPHYECWYAWMCSSVSLYLNIS